MAASVPRPGRTGTRLFGEFIITGAPASRLGTRNGAQAGPGTESVLDPDAPIADADTSGSAAQGMQWDTGCLSAGRLAAARGRMGWVTGPARWLSAAGVGQVRVGRAWWTGRSLLESGWYPPEADTPEKRLRLYARQFALVEVDATYYTLPAPLCDHYDH